jgi:DNA-binding LacI/PurR family transcriptional regulator
MDPQMLRHLREETAFGNRPIVTMCAPMNGFPAVICDEKEGARLALAYLLALGHRRILHFTRPSLGYPLSRRVEGYAAACSQAGLAMESSLSAVPIGHDHEVEVPLAEAVRRHPDATALLALNDPNALYSCYTLKRLGLRIPEDISVVGWDDSDPFPDANGVNQLTSVRFDIAGIGRAAANKLVALAEGAADTPVETVMPPELIARGSTAAPQRKQLKPRKWRNA